MTRRNSGIKILIMATIRIILNFLVPIDSPFQCWLENCQSCDRTSGALIKAFHFDSICFAHRPGHKLLFFFCFTARFVNHLRLFCWISGTNVVSHCTRILFLSPGAFLYIFGWLARRLIEGKLIFAIDSIIEPTAEALKSRNENFVFSFMIIDKGHARKNNILKAIIICFCFSEKPSLSGGESLF